MQADSIHGPDDVAAQAGSVRDGATGGWNRRRTNPMWLRDLLVVALTLVSGATDAVGFTRLGGVFTSVMTGNMVLLGISAGRRDGSLAIHTGVAFLCYVAGTLLGGRIAGRPRPDQALWPREVTIALYVELAVFAIFTVVWEATGAAPGTTAALCLLGVNAVALGMQSGAVLRFGVNGLSTTYLTGTLTTVIASLSSGRSTKVSGRSVAVLCALVAGAALGAVLALHAPREAPLALVVPLIAVIAGSFELHHHFPDVK